MASVAQCATCGTENPVAARFCMACGGSMEVPCTSCGTELPPGARFCFSCGHELEAGATDADEGQPAMAVTNHIADQLREITAGAGERRRITMMFCDIKDSTATAEGLDPEEWSDILRQAMDVFVSSVERYGGTVARLLGDAILAYFGAPEAHEDDPQRAILAGLEILDGTRALCEHVQQRHGTDFDVRIGINTGLVVVGDLGGQQLTEYAALGDAANVAARMEQTATPGTIRIAEDTHRLVAPLFEFESVGRLEVKGRGRPVEAHTVLRAIGRPGQVRGIEGLVSPMVGRDQELARLLAAADDVVAGSGRIVSVMAEAGLGKTRLVAELRRTLDERGDDVHWIAGQCHSYHDTTPYAPYLPALEACLEVDASMPPQDRTAHVVAQVTGLLGEDAREQALYLCRLLGLPLEADDEHLLSFLDPGTLRARTFGAVIDLVEGLAARQPVVLELEDLHWADPTSVELTEELLAVTSRVPVLLVLVFRPRRDEPSWGIHETAGREHAHRHVAVALRPLDTSQSEALVANLLKVEGLSQRVRSTILAKSEGNPFFVEEVIRSLLDDGTIVAEGDRFVATREITDVAVPDTLAAVLATRLDRLEPGARSIVQTASVLGREFPLATLRELVDPAIDLDAVVRDLERRELLVERHRDPEVVLAFAHELTRDTAHGTLLRSVRRELHRVVGELLEERHPDRVFELARHFVEADQPVRAVPHLVAAGAAAFAAFARADAADYFRRALDLWRSEVGLEVAREAHEGLGNACMFLGEMEAAEQALRTMLAFSREHGDPLGEVSALNKLGMVLLLRGRTDDAEAAMLEAKQLAEASGHQPGVAEFHVGYCYLNVSQGRLDEAERHLGEAAEVCFTLDSHHRNFGLLHYAESIIYQVRFDEAHEAVLRAREQAELDDDHAHLAGSWYAESLLEFYGGDVAAAKELALRGQQLAERVGAFDIVTSTAFVAGNASLQLGELDVARRQFRRIVDIAEGGGPSYLRGTGHVGLATVALWTAGPDHPEVDEQLAAARESLTSPLGQAAAGAVLAGIGEDQLLRGDIEAAEVALREGEATPSSMSKLTMPEIMLCGATIALVRGELDRAGSLFDDAIEHIETTGLELFRARALAGRGLVEAASGDVEGMLATFAAAEQDAVDRQQRLDTILVQRAAAGACDQAGRAQEAADVRGRLAGTVADVVARTEDHDLRRGFVTTNAVAG